ERPLSSSPPQETPQPCTVLGDEKRGKHPGAFEHREPRRIPGLGVARQGGLAGNSCQCREQRTVELVVVRRAEKLERPIPTPPPAIVPKRECAYQPTDPVGEELDDIRIICLHGEIVQSEQAEEVAVEHPRQWESWIFLVDGISALERSDPSLFHVFLEDLGGRTAQLQHSMVG